jgi:DNA-binding NtrC family response regulator
MWEYEAHLPHDRTVEGSRHVLLVEAETYVWDVVRYALVKRYRTSAVTNLCDARRVLDDDPADVIIVDVELMGLGLPLVLFGLRYDVPVVMTSNNYDLARRLMRLGCVILHKPHSPIRLRECVDDAITNSDNSSLRHRMAFERILGDSRERKALLQLFGDVRDDVLLALKTFDEGL